jgi:hypothetical protein
MKGSGRINNQKERECKIITKVFIKVSIISDKKMEKVNFNGPMEFPLRELLKKGISMVRDF